MISIKSILGDHAASLDPRVDKLTINIDITKYRFYMAARIDMIVISKLAATNPLTLLLYVPETKVTSNIITAIYISTR